MPEPQQLEYGQVYDVYRKLAADNEDIRKLTLPQFSQLAREASGQDVWGAGETDSALKRGVYWAEKPFKFAGKPLGAFAEAATSALGFPEYGQYARQMGEELPIGLLETGAMFAAPEATGAKWLLPRAAALTSNFLRTTAHTDSKLAGAASAATLGALPPMIRKGEKLAMRPIKKLFWEKAALGPVAEAAGVAERVVPQVHTPLMQLAERTAEFGGRNLAAAANQEMAIQSTSLAAGAGFVPYSDPQHMFELIGGQIPFSAIEALGVIRPRFRGEAGSNARAAVRQEMAQAQREVVDFVDTANKAVDEAVVGEVPGVQDILDRLEGQDRRNAVIAARKAREEVFKELSAARTEGRAVDESLFTNADEMHQRMLDRAVEDVFGRPDDAKLVQRDENGQLQVVADIDIDHIVNTRLSSAPDAVQEATALFKERLEVRPTGVPGSMLANVFGTKYAPRIASVVQQLIGPSTFGQMERRYNALYQKFYAPGQERQIVATYPDVTTIPKRAEVSLDSALSNVAAGKEYVLQQAVKTAKEAQDARKKAGELVTVKHMVFGKGTYVAGDMGPVTYQKVKGTSNEQAYIDGKPTDWLRYSTEENGTVVTKHRQAEDIELGEPAKVRLEDLQRNVENVAAKHAQIEEETAAKFKAATDHVIETHGGLGAMEAATRGRYGEVEWDVMGYEAGASPAERKLAMVGKLLDLMPDDNRKRQLMSWAHGKRQAQEFARLSTPDEIVLLEQEAQSVRREIETSGTEKMRVMAAKLDEVYVGQLTALAKQVQTDAGYSGSAVADKYATMSARRVQLLKEIASSQDNAATRLLMEAWNEREAQPKLVTPREGEVQGITAEKEQQLFEMLRARRADATYDQLFAGLNDVLYSTNLGRRSRGQGFDTVADVVSRVGLYRMFEFGNFMMDGYADVRANRLDTPAARLWQEAQKRLVQRRDPNTNPLDPRQIMAEAMWNKQRNIARPETLNEKAATFSQLVDEFTMLQENKLAFGQMDEGLYEWFQSRIEDYTDEALQARLDARIYGVVAHPQGDGVQMMRDVMSSLAGLKFEQGKLKDLALVNIVFDPATGRVDWARSGKVAQIERERAKAGGMPLHEVLANTREVLLNSADYGLDVGINTTGQLVVRTTAARGSAVEVKEAILQKVGAMSPELRALQDAYTGDVVESNKEQFPHSKIGTTVREAMRDNVRAKMPEASETQVQETAQAMWIAAKARYEDQVHSAFNVWAQGRKNKLSPVERVFRAAMGEVWKNRPQEAARPVTLKSKKTGKVADVIIATKLNPNETPDAFRAAVHNWAVDRFKEFGYSDLQARLMGDTATRIVAAYGTAPRGAKLVGASENARFFGATVTPEGLTPVMALMVSNSELFHGLPQRSQRAFMLSWLVGHETAHMLAQRSLQKALPAEVQAAMNNVWRTLGTMSDYSKRSVLKQVLNGVVPDRHKGALGYLIDSRLAYKQVSNVQEFLADFTSLKVMGLVRPATVGPEWSGSIGNFFKHGPDSLAQFERGLYTTMNDIVKVLDKAAERFEPIAHVRDTIQELSKGLDRALEEQGTIDRIGQQMDLLSQQSGAYAGFVGHATLPNVVDRLGVVKEAELDWVNENFDVLEATKPWLGLADRRKIEQYYGVGPNTVERIFSLPSMLAKRYPILRPVIDLVFHYHGMGNEAAHYMALPMLKSRKVLGMFEVGKKIDFSTTGLETIMKYPVVHKAASVVALLQQGVFDAEGNMVEPGRLLKDTEIRDIARREGVTKPAHQQAIVDFMHNAAQVSKRQREMMLKMIRERGALGAAERIMNRDKTMTAATAKQQGRQLFELVWTAVNNPQSMEALEVQRMLLAPEMADNVKAAQDFATRVKTFADRTEGQDWFFPEIRLGKYMVVWREGKQHGSRGFDSEVELANFLRTLEKQPGVSNIRSWNKYDRAKGIGGLNPGLLSNIANIEKAALLKEQIVSGWDGQEIRDFSYTPLQATLKQMEDRTVERFMRERKHTPGREELDMVRGFLVNITSTATGLAREITKAEVNLALNDPTLRGNEKARNWARDHFNAVVNPGSREFTMLKKLNFAQYMGLNLSSMIIEPTQQLIAMAPTLTRDTGNVLKGMGSIGWALKMLGKSSKGKGTLFERIHAYDPKLAEAMQDAYNRQVLDFGAMQEFHSAQDDALMNLRVLMSGGSLAEKATRGTRSAINSYVDFTRTIYSQIPKLNNIVAFMAAFESGRKHGVLKDGQLVKLSGKELSAYAEDTMRAAMYGGGTANRPGLFHNLGKFQGVVGLAYSLSTYTFGILSHFAKLGAESIDRRKMLTPAERKAARLALGQTIATQVALAGGLGLPGAGAALAVVEQVFGIPAKQLVEDGFEKLFGEDDLEAGGMLTDFALRGAPFAFAGVDLSSRLAISEVLGISAYDGFRVGNIMGPTGSMVENMVRATGQVTQGLVGDAAETVMPTAFKNVVKLWRDGWEVKDQYGRPLVQPNTGELLLDAIGLRPSKVVRAREAARQLRKSEQAATDEQGRFHRELGARLLEGDAVGVREALFERQQTVQGYSATAGAQAVADAALQLTVPFDPAREGSRVNATERQRLAARGGFRRTPEMERYVTKKRLEGAIGIPGVGRMAPSAMRQAALVDQLMDMNPFMSRQEALAIAGGQAF